MKLLIPADISAYGGPMNKQGSRVGITAGPLKLEGNTKDMRTILYALADALDQAEKLAELDLEYRLFKAQMMKEKEERENA